jgi:hypothetical protein
LIIPKFSATKNDAKLIAEVQNLKVCVYHIAKEYTTKNIEPNSNKIVACNNLSCFKIVNNNNKDGFIKVSYLNSNIPYCQRAKSIASKQQLIGNIKFGMRSVKY